MPKPLSEYLQAFFAGKLQDKTPLEVQLRETWRRLMGEEIAQATLSLQLRKQTLIICISDPLLRETLSWQKPELLRLWQGSGYPNIRKITIQ
ncbi:MAG: DUF721 domain-containing protein [Bacteroidia bacterium]|nr:DUF721 domain-containing protein [Bacteroidia bacterium]MDW8235959.1 DciA family protein [Bacteroidia bacterium]